MLKAFTSWRRLLEPAEPAENFLTVLVASSESGTGEVLTISTVEDYGTLTMDGRVLTATRAARVVCAGAANASTLAVTDRGRNLRQVQALTGQLVTIPSTPALSPQAAPDEAARWAAAVISAAVARQHNLPRPVWWPAGASVLAAPVHTAST